MGVYIVSNMGSSIQHVQLGLYVFVYRISILYNLDNIRYAIIVAQQFLNNYNSIHASYLASKEILRNSNRELDRERESAKNE